jgi:hypothetical protein
MRVKRQLGPGPGHSETPPPCSRLPCGRKAHLAAARQTAPQKRIKDVQGCFNESKTSLNVPEAPPFQLTCSVRRAARWATVSRSTSFWQSLQSSLARKISKSGWRLGPSGCERSCSRGAGTAGSSPASCSTPGGHLGIATPHLLLAPAVAIRDGLRKRLRLSHLWIRYLLEEETL